uniref:Uncharacterized protein n=1 Tax=Phlebotomus papatasi TaxID=29031 RepID=A0A1B0DNX1_PHLPP
MVANFLKHAPCMRHVKKQYETCSSTYQATMSRIGQIVPEPSDASFTADRGDDHNLTRAHSYEIERIKTVCCAFKDYIDCSEQVVRLACGEETANYTRRFLDKMSSSLMTPLDATQKSALPVLTNHSNKGYPFVTRISLLAPVYETIFVVFSKIICIL